MYNTEQNDIFISYRNTRYKISFLICTTDTGTPLSDFHLAYFICFIFFVKPWNWMQYNNNNIRQISGKAQFEVSSVGI